MDLGHLLSRRQKSLIAMNKYLHITFNYVGHKGMMGKVQPIISQYAVDWLRYAPYCWIVYTSDSPYTWVERLRPLMGADENVLIFELNYSNYYGWTSDLVRKWLHTPRS